MKKNILIFLLFCFSNFALAQDYKKKIARSSCECITKVADEIKDPKTREMRLGLCMITAAMPYSKELKRDYNIDVNNVGAESEKSFESLGGAIGIVMATECPDIFTSIFTETDDSSSTSGTEFLLNGMVKKIEKENFIVFHVIGDNNNLTKFYWVTSIESNLDLPKEYNMLLNKSVNISYYTAEIFDAKNSDYKNLNIISSLKTED